MQLKEIIKNPKLYFTYALGRLLRGSVEADAKYLKLLYKVKTGNALDLEDPKAYNEKLQWLKLYDRKPEYTQMVDKYEAKKYVASIIGEEYIIPTLGVWDRFDDIDFDELPDQFVLKCTHDSGGLVIVRDKKSFDRESARKKINHCLRRNYYWNTREWPYKDVKPRILAEAYMETSRAEGLTDYKFYCFNGIPRFLYLSKGLENHETAQISFLNLDWERMPFKRNDYAPIEDIPLQPKRYSEMISLTQILSAGKRFLRVDLYEINGRIYFSELTFSPCSGMMPFDPEEWDYKIGEWLDLSGAND